MAASTNTQATQGRNLDVALTSRPLSVLGTGETQNLDPHRAFHSTSLERHRDRRAPFLGGLRGLLVVELGELVELLGHLAVETRKLLAVPRTELRPLLA